MSTQTNRKRQDSAEPNFATAPITPAKPRISLVPGSVTAPKVTRPTNALKPAEAPSGPEGDPLVKHARREGSG